MYPFFYIDQNATVWNFIDRTQHKVSFNMDTHFRLCGNSLKQYTTCENFSPDDALIIPYIRNLRVFATSEYNNLVDQYSKHSNLSAFNTKNNSLLNINTANHSFNFTLKRKNKELKKTLSSPAIHKLLKNTAWFEYETAMLLKEWKFAKEIRLNCIFSDKNNSPKNEIDIIVNTGNKLLFVECKTQITNETDIDKFNSAVKNYGGMGSKALFITDEIMSLKAIEKCNEYHILHFSLKNNRLINPKDALFLLLENELFNINSK
jgi:hypothetical protein